LDLFRRHAGEHLQALPRLGWQPQILVLPHVTSVVQVGEVPVVQLGTMQQPRNTNVCNCLHCLLPRLLDNSKYGAPPLFNGSFRLFICSCLSIYVLH
jgi:hypothetical protein